MGANQLGFLVKGPANISDKRDQAIDLLKQRTMKLKGYQAQLNELKEESVESWSDLFPGDDEVSAYLDENALTPSDAVHALESLMPRDAAADVDKFIHFWQVSGARDVAYRIDPDDQTQAIVFAGEMSWGDEPSGMGYEMLDEAKNIGLLEIFGIR